jgi:hypothetical protein
LVVIRRIPPVPLLNRVRKTLLAPRRFLGRLLGLDPSPVQAQVSYALADCLHTWSLGISTLTATRIWRLPAVASIRSAILLGNGDGTFINQLVSFVAGELPASLVAAGFNGAGKLDLALANVDSYNVSILTNTTP